MKRNCGRRHVKAIGVMVVVLATLGAGCRDDGNDGYEFANADESGDSITADDGTPRSATTDATSDASDTADTSDTADPSDTSDTSDTADTSDTSPRSSDGADATATTDAPDDTQPPSGTEPDTSAAPTTAGAQPTTTTQPSTTTQPTTTTQPVDAATLAFCDAFVAAETSFSRGPDIDFANSTAEQIVAAVEAHRLALEPLLAAAAATAPAGIAPDIETVVTMIRSSLDAGEDLESNTDYGAADERVDLFVADSCGYDTIAVSGVEYAFSGLPASLPAGRTTFAFTNNGAEIHEMLVFRINDGVTETVDELLALPEDEALAKVQFAGATFGVQGETDTETFELTPGRYVALCFVPVGTTGDVVDENAEPGPPHSTEGMKAAFTVV